MLREEESCLVTQSRMFLSKIIGFTGIPHKPSPSMHEKSQSSPPLLNCRFDRGEEFRRPSRQFCVTRHALLSDVLDNVVLESRDQVLADRDRVFDGGVWIQERVTISQELFDSRSLRGITIQTTPECPDQATRNRDASDAYVRKADGVVGIRYRHYFSILIRDVGKGRLAIGHLVQNTSQAPHVARFAKFHDLTHDGRLSAASI